MSDNEKIQKPEIGEQTKKQFESGVSSTAPFLGEIVHTGTFSTYRKIRGNPTVALARMVATAPIRTASWSVEAKNEADDNMVELIQDQMNALWPKLINDILTALDYGYAGFEKVWQVKDGKLVYDKIKPLLVDNTSILVDEYGNYRGLRQGKIDLGIEKSFIYTYDGEAGDLYGRSRHENIREDAWQPWLDAAAKRKAYITKTAGVIPVIEYPEGASRDESGSEKSNFDLAKAVLEKLGKGNGVAMPNVFAKYAGDLSRAGIDINQLKAWQISFLEPKGDHTAGYTETMRHLESLMMRGWLVPERTATEGQYGTKAEAGEHAEISLTVADILLLEIVRTVNSSVVDPLLVYNWGPAAKGLVYLQRAGLSAELKQFFRDIIKAVLTNPSNIDLLFGMVDIDALLDNAEIPKAAEVIDPEKINRSQPAGNPAGDALSRAVSKIYKGIYAAKGL